MSGHRYETRHAVVAVCKWCGYVRGTAGYPPLPYCPGPTPLEGTPPGTRLSFLTPDGVVVVMGTPGDDHNCAAMGCGSVSDHVVERINVRELREQNALLVAERNTLRDALKSMTHTLHDEANEARYALEAAAGLWDGRSDRP